MEYEADDENNTSYKEYKRSVRERASDSMYLLQRTLESTPVVTGKDRRGFRPNRSPHSASPRQRSPGGQSPRARSPRTRSPVTNLGPRNLQFQDNSLAWESPRNTEHSDYSYGAAVGRLRSMLRKHDDKSPKNVQFSDRPYGTIQDALSYAPAAYTPSPLGPYRGVGLPVPRGEIPTQEECVPLLQNQSVLVQQLEAENRFCKDELHVLKLKVREVAEENRLLHEELKRSVIQEILQEGIDVPGIPSTVSIPAGVAMQAKGQEEVQGRTMVKEDWTKWQKELERISTLHIAKASRLETQLQHTRDELSGYERETEDLRKELRMRDSLSKADPELLGLAAGLCIRCATNEAVIQPSAGASQSVAIVTRERDDLMEQLAVLKTRYEELRHREDDMYQQMKRSIEMVEQAHLEETQLIIQRDQLKEELASIQSRVAEHAEDVMEKMAQERNIVRKEYKADIDELNAKVKEMTESLVETQNQLEKTTRDKISLIADLHATRGHADICDIDYGKATDNMKVSMTQATLERNSAIGEMTKMKSEFDRMEKDREQERSRIRQELFDTKRRLNQAEKELIETKEECINLTNITQQLEREAHLAKLSRDSIEKNRSDDIKNVSKRAEHREAELNMLLDQLETKHTSTSNELENIVGSQSSLVQKLRSECRKLAHKLEDITCKYRGDNKKLKNQNDQLRTRLDRALTRLRDLEDQHIQHGILQDKMRQRLRQMDEHSGKTTQQVLELLAKESALMRDRQLLAKEVEFLRRQLLDRNEAEMTHFYSSQKGLVDGILLDVKGEEEAKILDTQPDHRLDEIPVLESELIIGLEDL